MKLLLTVAAAIVVVAGATTPGYDPWRDPISLLASPGQPHAVAARLALVLAAGAVAVVAHRERRRTPIRALLTAAALAGTVTAIAPKDLPGTTPSTTLSQVHVVAAIAAGAAFVAAMLLARSTAAAVATVALAVAFQRTWGTPIRGAVERALVAVPLAWCTTLK